MVEKGNEFVKEESRGLPSGVVQNREYRGGGTPNRTEKTNQDIGGGR